MSYKALYRTYRPTTFGEVAGQSHIVKTLKNALATNKIAHAYLFCGPRGTGKTTMAKLLAKALNCEEGQGHQCNHCSNCLAINDGSHPDVIEIDAASNNGVEDVRDIIERVKYSPIKGKYKVYIIDEVHMMSPNAFNALLKTLEEPPANVIFILATTEPHKVLPTILSRCQRYDFAKVDDMALKDRVEHILRTENITYEDKAIDMIIDLADGGVRDALSLMDQAIAYSGNNVTEKDIEDIFGLISINEIVDLILQISNGNVDYVINKTNALIEHGTDIRHLVQDLLDVYKDIVIFNKLNSEKYLVKINKEQANKLCNIITSAYALEMIEILMKAQAEFKVVNNIKTLFEVTLLKMALSKNTSGDVIEHKEPTFEVPPLKQVIQKEETTKAKFVKEEPIAEPEPVQVQEEIIEEPVEDVPEEIVNEPEEIPSSSEPSEETSAPVIEDEVLQADELPPFMVEKQKIEEEEKDVVVPSMKMNGTVNALSDDDIIRLMVLGNKNAKAKLMEKWSNLQSLILNSKYSKYAALLRDGKPFIFTKDILVLQYEFDHLAKKVNITDNQLPLQEVIEKIYGMKTRVYGINRKLAVDLYTRFQKLYQVGKLPKAETIKIDYKF